MKLQIGDIVRYIGTGREAPIHTIDEYGVTADTAWGKYGFNDERVSQAYGYMTIERELVKTGKVDVALALRQKIHNQKHNIDNMVALYEAGDYTLKAANELILKNYLFSTQYSEVTIKDGEAVELR